MKRAILVMFGLTLVLAVPLAGCGLTQAAGSVLLGGGGLSFILIMALAFVSGRAAAAPREHAADTAATATPAEVVTAKPVASTATPAATAAKPAVAPAKAAAATAKPARAAAQPAATTAKPAATAARPSGKAAKRAAKRAARAAHSATPPTATTSVAAAPKTTPPVAAAPTAKVNATATLTPTATVVEVVDERASGARAPELEEVAAFFVDAAARSAPPPADDFAADELAFFAEGENLALRAGDSSPSWHLN